MDDDEINIEIEHVFIFKSLQDLDDNENNNARQDSDRFLPQ